MKAASSIFLLFPPLVRLRQPRRCGALALAAICACAAGANVACMRVASAHLASPGQTLTVRYPAENAHLPFVARSFVFGAAPRDYTVTVNDRQALVAPDGAWIAYVPFSPGRFVLHVAASGQSGTMGDTYVADRTVFVDDGHQPA